MAVETRRKRASIHALGCRLNQSEAQLLTERLLAAGYELAPIGEPADLAIINTCTVTQEADAKSRKLVRQFIRRNPGAYTAVIGCYAQMGADKLAAIPGVDLVIGNEEKLRVLDYVAAGKPTAPIVVRDRMRRDAFTIDVTDAGAPLPARPNLKIQDGCDFMCSFCIIPFARGRARSRELENALAEARSLAARGARELVLTGVNIGAFEDGAASILEAVDALDAIPGIRRIRISSIEPTTIPEALFARMADPDHALLPYLHIPLQSGANPVLERMRRRYTREAFLDFVNRAHDRVPGICIGTDVLAGFPGETEPDFEATCDALWRSPIVYAHVFKYSARPGAASARMPDQLPPETIRVRAARLRGISAEKTRMYQEHFLGDVAEVLFEQQEGPYWTGYSPGYIRVAARSATPLANRIAPVRLERIAGDFVLGSLAAAPA